MRVAENAVREFLKELHVQAVVRHVILIVEKVEIHGLAEQRGLDGDGRVVGYDAVADREHRRGGHLAAGYGRRDGLKIEELIGVPLYNKHLLCVEGESLDKLRGLERLTLAEGGGVEDDLASSEPGIGLVKLPLCLGLTLAEPIHAGQADIVENVGAHAEGGAVEGVEGSAAGNDDVIVAVHAHLAGDNVAPAEFLAQRLIAGLFDLAHGVPHLDDSELLFVVKHGNCRPIGVQKAYPRGGEVVHAL